jgi:hypothetical protein
MTSAVYLVRFGLISWNCKLNPSKWHLTYFDDFQILTIWFNSFRNCPPTGCDCFSCSSSGFWHNHLASLIDSSLALLGLEIFVLILWYICIFFSDVLYLTNMFGQPELATDDETQTLSSDSWISVESFKTLFNVAKSPICITFRPTCLNKSLHKWHGPLTALCMYNHYQFPIWTVEDIK